MRLGQITHTEAEAKKSTVAETKLTRSDISFTDGDEYATLQLKRSKTDVEHTGVQIILAAKNPCPPNASMFRLSYVAFSRQNVVAILKKQIASEGLSESDFSCHSFHNRAAQHAADSKMLDESIQRLGHWTSNTFKIYFTTTPKTLFSMNLSF